MTSPNRSTSNIDPNRTGAHELEDDNRTTDHESRGAGTTKDQKQWRYLLNEQLGEGGMGVVFRAKDTVFHREVAVKLLHERFGPDSGVAVRFTEEARITGQLQHPAIPPVHDLGVLPDGRAYLAMKLIRGRTLAALLRERADPAQERLRFLAIFEQICHGVGYAHAHGVIHRDLKPANVMVGSFGEVQVMDWGLAKIIVAGDDVVREVRDANADATQYGAVLGTLAFMAPEQARGEIEAVDAQSDVFGLGGILAVVLTGKPPFLGTSMEALQIQAASGDLSECFARLDACGAELELVALCKRCLSAHKADRPANGTGVADAIEAFRLAAEERTRLAEVERVRAEGETVTARMQAAEQKKRRVVQAWVFALSMLLLALVVWVLWSREQQARAAQEANTRNVAEVTRLLDESEKLLREQKTEQAKMPLQAARHRAEEARTEDLLLRFRLLQRDWELLRELDKVDVNRWTWNENSFPNASEVAADFGRVLQTFQIDPDRNAPAAVIPMMNASTLRERLIGVLDRLLVHSASDNVREVLRQADGDDFRSQIRDAVLAKDTKKIRQLAKKREAAEQPSWFVAVLGENKAVQQQRRRELLQLAISRLGSDLPLVMALVAQYSPDKPEELTERLIWCQVAVAVAPENFATLTNLGNALQDKNDLGRSETAYRQAIQINPTHPFGHSNLGNVLNAKGDLPGAEKAYHEALRLDPKLAGARSNLGNLLFSRGDKAGAENAYRAAIAADPQLALAHYNLGVLLRGKGDLAGAEVAYREAIRANPKLAAAHGNLGNLLRGQGKSEEAEKSCREAIRLDPKLIAAHNNLGLVLAEKGKLTEARQCFEEVLRLDPKHKLATNLLSQLKQAQQLLAQLPDILSGKAQAKNATQLCELANLCCLPQQKRFATASTLFTRAFATEPKLASDLNASHRYNAVCAAIRAANGEGVDSPKDVASRRILRTQALSWLRADLAVLEKQANSAEEMQRILAINILAHWQSDSDFVSVRDPIALTKLSDEEAAQWWALWATVRVTRTVAENSDAKAEVLPMPRKE